MPETNPCQQIYNQRQIHRGGVSRFEREGERARDLLRRDLLSENGQRGPSIPHLYFNTMLESPPGVAGLDRNHYRMGDLQVCIIDMGLGRYRLRFGHPG